MTAHDDATALDDRDKDPNLDEYAYEHRVDPDFSDDPDPEGSAAPGGTATGGADDGPGGGADEHADNPHPDADGDVTEQTGNDPTRTIADPGRPDPAAPDDPTGIIDPKAD